MELASFARGLTSPPPITNPSTTSNNVVIFETSNSVVSKHYLEIVIFCTQVRVCHCLLMQRSL
jgi:hypothetical protein